MLGDRRAHFPTSLSCAPVIIQQVSHSAIFNIVPNCYSNTINTSAPSYHVVMLAVMESTTASRSVCYAVISASESQVQHRPAEKPLICLTKSNTHIITVPEHTTTEYHLGETPAEALNLHQCNLEKELPQEKQTNKQTKRRQVKTKAGTPDLLSALLWQCSERSPRAIALLPRAVQNRSLCAHLQPPLHSDYQTTLQTELWRP